MALTVRFAANEKELDAGYALRREVFEVEQGVPRPLDRDAHDFNADHVVAYDETGACVGTGRVVRIDNRTCQIGRMAVSKARRKGGVGAAVLEFLERMAALRGLAEIVVNAQLPAIPFYENRGYARASETFLDQGVPHVRMRKVLVRGPA